MIDNEHPLKTRSIFLCYRQEDSRDVTGRIFDKLDVEFPGQVFMDMVIPFGVDFRGYIQKVLCQCKVVLVVVGPRWTSIQDSKGLVRLADKDDCVRFEIETALAQPGLVVIPVAVGGDGFPDKKDVEALPDSLQPLFKLNGPEVRHGRDFPHDMIELISSIRVALKREPEDIHPQPCPEKEQAETPKTAPAAGGLQETTGAKTVADIETPGNDRAAASPPLDETPEAGGSIRQATDPCGTSDPVDESPPQNDDPSHEAPLPHQSDSTPHVSHPDEGEQDAPAGPAESAPKAPQPHRQSWVAVVFKLSLLLLVFATSAWWIQTELSKRDESRRQTLAQELAQKQAAAQAETERLAQANAEAEARLKAAQDAVDHLSQLKQESDRKLKEAEAERSRLVREKAAAVAQAEADRKAKELAEADRSSAAKLMAAQIAAAEAEKAKTAAAEAAQRQKEWPKGASLEHPFKNSLGMIFVATDKADLLFCIHPTQVANFKVFVDTTGYDAVNESKNGDPAHSVQRNGTEFKWLKKGASWKDADFPAGARQAADHPVVCVSYFDALNFCAWLTGKEHDEGMLPAGWAYRLPTDEEWTRACGGGKYPWGDAAPPGGINGNYAGEESRLSATDVDSWNPISGYRDSFPRTCAVGSFKANAYGLYDMGGNVWQWCDTWYRAAMNDEETKKEWPKAREDDGGSTYRVGRGGAWSTRHETRLRTLYHDFAAPVYRDDSTGFRCVLAPVAR